VNAKEKDFKEMDIKVVKSTKLCNTNIEVWENMVESPIKESFVESVVQSQEVCRNFQSSSTMSKGPH